MFSVNMPLFVKEASNRISNFKGIKFTSNDLAEAAQVLRVLKDDQEIFLGADTVSYLKNKIIFVCLSVFLMLVLFSMI